MATEEKGVRESFILTDESKGESEEIKSQDRNAALKWLRFLVKSLSAFTILLLIGLLAVTIKWYAIRKEELEPREHVICLNCTELKSRYEDEHVLETFTIQNQECCGSTSQILKRLVDKNTREKYRNDLANNFFATTSKECKKSNQIPEKPSAKVAGIAFTDMEQETSSLNIVHWNSTGPESFTKSDIHYTAGKLQVKQPGFYYIFSQLKWFLNSSNTLPVRHEVILHSYEQGVYETLLESRKTKCNLIEESGEITSSIGAVFELRQKDKIFVTTSKPESLSPCHHGNFFGLYLVSYPVIENR